MGVIARQSIKGALANYLGVIIGFITTFFVLTDCLSQEEIGLTRVMVDAAMLFSGLAQLGTNASILRFYPYFKDPDHRDHGFFGWSVLLPFIGFVLFAIFFFVFKEPIQAKYAQESPLIVDYFYLLLPLTFFALYLTVFETNASVLMHITVPKFVREVGIRLFNLVCYLLYGHGVISLDMFVLLFCGSYALAMLLNFFYLLTLGKISFRIDFPYTSKPLLREIAVYTLFMTATVLAGNIPLINSLFLGAKKGLTLVGVYTIASYIANIVEVPYRSLGAISQPLISQAVKDNNWQEVNRLGQQVSLHQFLVACLIFFCIWINLNALFSVIPHGSEYVGGIGVVFFLGLAKILNSSLSIGTNILNFSKFYPFALPFIAVLTASAILFNLFLIPRMGINGPATATLLAYCIYFATLLLFLGLKLKVVIFSRKQLTTLALVLVMFGLNWLWNLGLQPLIVGNGSLGRILVDAGCRTLVLMTLAIVAAYKLNISPNINGIIDKYLGKVANKVFHSKKKM